ncbi:MAG TPA: DUF3108 domain-containing protein [Haliangiales bacterium]|nr:DUF3108 domain-containing protein [Haliangiales bacterium]
MDAPVYHRFAAAAIALAACRSGNIPSSTTPVASAADLRVTQVRFVPGETITWSVTFAGVLAARARLAVGEGQGHDGRKEIVVRAEAGAAGLGTLVGESQEVLSSWIDPQTGVPIQTEHYGINRERTQRTLVTRAAGKAELLITRARTGEPPAPPVKRTHLLPPVPVYDNLAALAALRGWDARPGGRATLWAFSGTQLWRTVVEVEKEEELDTDVGRLPARKLVATSVRMTTNLREDTSRPARKWAIWISTDERRIPLRIDAHLDFGDVVVRASSYATEQGED